MNPNNTSGKVSAQKKMISIEFKHEMIEKYEQGVRVSDLVIQYGRTTSTRSTLLKQKEAMKVVTPVKDITLISKLQTSIPEEMERLLGMQIGDIFIPTPLTKQYDILKRERINGKSINLTGKNCFEIRIKLWNELSSYLEGFVHLSEENPTRKQLFRHLKVVLFQNVTHQCIEEGSAESLGERTRTFTENFISTETHWSLPLPPNIHRVHSKPQAISKEKFSEVSTSMEEYQSEEGSNSLSSILSAEQSEQDSDKNLADMKIILEILYRIFARIFAYKQILRVFSMMPSLEQIKLPLPLKIPKPLAKPDVPGPSKSERSTKKLSLTEKCSEEIEAERQLTKNNYILPLEVSEEAKEYLKQQSSERSVLWRIKEDKSKK